MTDIAREVRTLQLGDKESGFGEVEQDNRVVQVDPATILIQILFRESDPLPESLVECMAMWASAGYNVQPMQDRFGGWIDTTRNWQLQLFLRKAPKHIRYCLLIDSDIHMKPEIPALLARHDLPIVTGVAPCFTPEKGIFLNIAVKASDGRARFPSVRYTKKIPAQGLIEIHNCGAAVMMVRRDVVEALYEKFYDEKKQEAAAKDAILAVLQGDEVDDEAKAALWKHVRKFNHKEDNSGPPFNIPQSLRDEACTTGVMPRGEDICFTDRVRELGFKVYADFEARVMHSKRVALQWPANAIDPEIDLEDWKLSAFEPNVTER